MPDADEEPGRRPHELLWAIPLVADVSAWVGTFHTNAKNIFAIVGSSTLLFGILKIIGRRGKPVDWRIGLAVFIIIASAGVLGLIGGQSLVTHPQNAIGTESAGNPKNDGPDSGPTTRQNQPSSPTFKSSPKSPEPVSLLDMTPINEDDYTFTVGPMKVNAVMYERTLYGDGECSYHYHRNVYQLDRKYRTFQAKIGVGDDTEHKVSVRFILSVDDAVRRTGTVTLGQSPIPLEADITGAFRLKLQLEFLVDVCSGDIYGALIDPVVTA